MSKLFRFDNSIVVTIFVILIKVLLDYIYLNHVEPENAYMGYKANPTIESYIYSYLILIPSIYLVIPYFKYEGFFVSNIVILLYLIGFLPITSIIACDPQPGSFIFSIVCYWYLILILPRKIRLPDIRVHHVSTGIIILVGFFFSLVVLYISWMYADFRLTISLEDVYEYRAQSREFPISKLVVYLWSASRLVLPIITAFCLMKGKYLISLYFIFILIVNFSIDGMKSTLASLVICILLFLFVKNDVKKKYPVLLLILLFVALLEYYYLDFSFTSHVILRRNFYFTAIMDTRYFDLIQTVGPRFYSNEVNGKDIAFYVGENIFNSDGMRANNGLFSDAYMNLGFGGCILYPFIYSYLFHISEALLKHANRGLVLLLCLLWAYKMRGSTITTALITHGVFVAVLFLSLMPSISRNEIIKKR